MGEHVPNRYLLAALTLFFWAMSAAALAFWVGGLVWPGGIRGLIASLGAGAVAIFVTLHIPAAIVGILLWQWRRATMPPRRRVLLEAATLYFCLSVLLSMFLNYLLASLLDDLL